MLTYGGDREEKLAYLQGPSLNLGSNGSDDGE
jgi:hypothetical protein